MTFIIRPLTDSDRAWLAQHMRQHWGSSRMVSRGKLYETSALPGFVALLDGERAGAAAYHVEDGACELRFLESLARGQGVGAALVEAVKDAARQAGCARLWLITTNDNTLALRFYQKRGFRLVAVYPDAVTEARKLKPEIPATGDDGIPIRDEIELETTLQ